MKIFCEGCLYSFEKSDVCDGCVYEFHDEKEYPYFCSHCNTHRKGMNISNWVRRYEGDIPRKNLKVFLKALLEGKK